MTIIPYVSVLDISPGDEPLTFNMAQIRREAERSRNPLGFWQVGTYPLDLPFRTLLFLPVPPEDNDFVVGNKLSTLAVTVRQSVEGSYQFIFLRGFKAQDILLVPHTILDPKSEDFPYTSIEADLLRRRKKKVGVYIPLPQEAPTPTACDVFPAGNDNASHTQ